MYVFTERRRRHAAPLGRLLPQGRLPAAAADAEAHVPHQLRRDGARLRRAALLPPHARAADQGTPPPLPLPTLRILALTSFVRLAKALSPHATRVSPVLLDTLAHTRALLPPLETHLSHPSSVSHTLSHALSGIAMVPIHTHSTGGRPTLHLNRTLLLTRGQQIKVPLPYPTSPHTHTFNGLTRTQGTCELRRPTFPHSKSISNQPQVMSQLYRKAKAVTCSFPHPEPNPNPNSGDSRSQEKDVSSF